jgi:hypothetical protein
MADSDPNPAAAPNIASPEGAYPNYMSPADIGRMATLLTGMSGGAAPVNHQNTVNQFMQWLAAITGGGMGAPGGGANPMTPGIPDALGMGAGGADALGMGFLPTGGLNPYQMADLRMQRRHRMNQLNQRMANQHRGVGPLRGNGLQQAREEHR